MAESTARKATAKKAAEPKQTPKDKALGKARSQAVTTLTVRYRDEFNALIRDNMLAAGFEWSPRPTPAQTAAAKIRELLGEHPELKSEFGVVDDRAVEDPDQTTDVSGEPTA